MYHYIYDSFLSHKRYQETLARIETKATLLDIKGPITRLHPLTKMSEAVKRALTRGATTIVAVGDDHTFLELLNTVPNKKTVCGYVFIGTGEKEIAKVLNLIGPDESIEAIAGRKLATISAGLINNKLFLEKVTIETKDFTAVIDDQVSLKVSYPRSIFTITNPNLTAHASQNANFLDMRIMPIKKRVFSGDVRERDKESRFLIEKVIIKSQEPMVMTIDSGKETQETVITAGVAPKAATIIVGREKYSS